MKAKVARLPLWLFRLFTLGLLSMLKLQSEKAFKQYIDDTKIFLNVTFDHLKT